MPRRRIHCMAMSIDGFVAGPNHGRRQSDGVSTEQRLGACSHRRHGVSRWRAGGKQSRVTNHRTHNGDIGEHDPQELLGIYLDDHWAGAGAGTSLANRLASENEGTKWYGELRRIADEIEEDQRTLGGLREACGSDGFSVKRLVAQAVERVA